MVAKAPRMDGRGHEGVAEGVHGQKGRRPRGVAEVVDIGPFRQGGAGGGLAGDHPQILAVYLVPDEGKGEAGEVAAAAHAPDHDVRVLAHPRHLLLGLEADDRLVHEHVVQHAAQGIPRVLRRDRVLDRLADGDAEAARDAPGPWQETRSPRAVSGLGLAHARRRPTSASASSGKASGCS